jgi:sigma-E factor negative regulatory protein RseA
MNMSETVKEQLSAFLDGELPEAETELLLRRLERDPDLKETLSRYSLIGAALRTENHLASGHHVADRVRAALATEPLLPVAVRARPLLRPLSGLAVAASVAALAVLGLQQWWSGEAIDVGAEPAAVVAQSAPAPVAPPAATAAAVAAGEEAAPAGYTTPDAPQQGGMLAPAELASYVLAHSDFASPLSRRSVLTGIVVEPAAEAGRQGPVAGPAPPAQGGP